MLRSSAPGLRRAEVDDSRLVTEVTDGDQGPRCTGARAPTPGGRGRRPSVRHDKDR